MRKSTRLFIVMFFVLLFVATLIQPVRASTDSPSGLLDAVVSGGPVAVLAFIIWWQSRADSKNNREQWQTTCKELMEIKKDDIKSREDNTKALQELSDTVKKAANGRSPPQ
jgi:hypothetical protein